MYHSLKKCIDVAIYIQLHLGQKLWTSLIIMQDSEVITYSHKISRVQVQFNVFWANRPSKLPSCLNHHCSPLTCLKYCSVILFIEIIQWRILDMSTVELLGISYEHLVLRAFWGIVQLSQKYISYYCNVLLQKKVPGHSTGQK